MPAPAALRRPTRALSFEHGRAALDLVAIAPSWLQPRFPLVNALIHELLRLERHGAFSDSYRPPRVSRTHRRSTRKAR